jgi:hypothetical protein
MVKNENNNLKFLLMKKKLMKKNLLLCATLITGVFSFTEMHAQIVLPVVLEADNIDGNTYELINSKLANPGGDAIETPDAGIYANHASFGRHIEEVDDADLGKKVFKFYSHVEGGIKDAESSGGVAGRQRLEIKTYNNSPDELKGFPGDVVEYKWSFKVPMGFLPTSAFTHIHQVKAFGDANTDDDNPLFTLTLRRTSAGNKRLELIYDKDAPTAPLTITPTIPFANFEGIWVDVTETIKAGTGTSGTYSMVIKKHSDNSIIFNYSNPALQTIRPAYTAPSMTYTANQFIRPKWGIYRSLKTTNTANPIVDYIVPTEIKDETLLFSDFSIDKLLTLSVKDSVLENIDVSFPNPVSTTLKLSETILNNFTVVHIYDLKGKEVKKATLESDNLNVNSLNAGLYLVRFEGNGKVSKSVKMIKN